MSVPLAYLGVILIWSTTPLGIKWSSEQVGFLFGASARMVIGAVLTLALLLLLRQRLVWHRQAVKAYLAATLGIYGAMMCVYAGARFIPSGLVAVLFGLTPFMVGVMATLLLGERSFTGMRLAGLISALSGLYVIFVAGTQLGPQAPLGIGLVLLSTLLHSTSTVLLKRIQAQLPAVVINAGGLLLASLLFLTTWSLVDGQWPRHIPMQAGLSILYLGSIATVAGFSLYFFLLRNLEAHHVGLIPMITPVTALLLGHLLNDEPVSASLVTGTALITGGLLFYQWGHHARRWLLAARPAARSSDDLLE